MPKEITKALYRTEEAVTDVVTGEVIETRVVTAHRIEREPNFVKLYIDTMKAFNGAHDIPTDVLLAFTEYVDYANSDREQQQIYLPKPIKQKIAEKVGISFSMVDKYIKKMVDAGVLFKSNCRGFFIVNPWLIAKGDWKNISKLRAEFDFFDGTWVYRSGTPRNSEDNVT